VPAERVINALSPKDRNRKPPRTPRVVELFRKAPEWQALLQSGQVHNQAEIARREGITRARVTQVMALLRGHCGCGMVGELKKEQYVYYHY
jgi:hypothetical protein